ncbi:hypothetical protein M6D81_14930 [Paenibacillus sp. J5C_2022]|uniref:hypothetical protein n=1 Tax=Paenibacillus sp. J5C2022 TaxID=2977129 RepID=UPI0021D1F0E4|nr:hypothetical protein [Paenibacillus sp. J5C2022]MCU6709988.1 hypothetical protein [Paenibacillus sp. J5C2022]
MDDRDVKHILQHLYHSDRLERYLVRSWRVGAAEVRTMAEELLMEAHARHPLTPLEQRMLRESYLIRKLNRNQLAESFHMSRTTFYRHSLTAMRHLARLMEERRASCGRHNG